MSADLEKIMSACKEANDKLVAYNKNKDKYSNLKLLSIQIVELLKSESSINEPICLDDMIDYLEQIDIDTQEYRNLPTIHYGTRDKAKDSIGKELAKLQKIHPSIKKIGASYYYERSNTDKDYYFIAFDSVLANKGLNYGVQAFTISALQEKFAMNDYNWNNIFPISFKQINNQTIPQLSDKLLIKQQIYRSINHHNIRIEYRDTAGDISTYRISPYCIFIYKDKAYVVGKEHNYRKAKDKLIHFDTNRIIKVEELIKQEPYPLKDIIQAQQYTEEEVEAPRLVNIIKSVAVKDKYEEYLFYRYFIDNICKDIEKISFEFNIQELNKEVVLKEFGDITLTPITQDRVSATVVYPVSDFISWAIKYYDRLSIKNKAITKVLEKKYYKLKQSYDLDDDEMEEVYIKLFNYKNEQLINKEFGVELMIVDAYEKTYKFEMLSSKIKKVVEYALLNPNILRIQPESETAYDEIQERIKTLYDKVYDEF